MGSLCLASLVVPLIYLLLFPIGRELAVVKQGPFTCPSDPWEFAREIGECVYHSQFALGIANVQLVSTREAPSVPSGPSRVCFPTPTGVRPGSRARRRTQLPTIDRRGSSRVQ